MTHVRRLVTWQRPGSDPVFTIVLWPDDGFGSSVWLRHALAAPYGWPPFIVAQLRIIDVAPLP